MTVDTTKVTQRRDVRYNSFDELLDDARRLVAADTVTLGNWSLGQILEHVAKALDMTVDGFNMTAPWYVRLVGRFVLKRFLHKKMPAGFKLPASAKALLPPETDAAAALEHLERAVARIKSESRRAPHPVLGPLTLEESNLLQLRHAELHLSFVKPA